MKLPPSKGYVIVASKKINFYRYAINLAESILDFHEDAKETFEALMAQGVITRPMVGYGLPTCLRISVGLQEENQKLIEALDLVMGR